MNTCLCCVYCMLPMHIYLVGFFSRVGIFGFGDFVFGQQKYFEMVTCSDLLSRTNKPLLLFSYL